ncbi:transcriptional regulator [Klebsiella pneumoniae]|nr:transcriptional regulator [Klebsiella pneumoniae]
MATLKELMAKQSPDSQQRIAAKAAEIRQSVALKLASRRVANVANRDGCGYGGKAANDR